MKLVLVFIGGGLGSCLRYAVGRWLPYHAMAGLPIATLSVNMIGCLLIGFLTPLLTASAAVREAYRVAILVGLLGGFTTFSTYAWETNTLAGDGRWLIAAANVVISNVAGLAAAWLGWRAAGLVHAI